MSDTTTTPLDLSMSVKSLKKLIPDSPLESLLDAVAHEEVAEAPRLSLLIRLRKEIEKRDLAEFATADVEVVLVPERAREDDGTFVADDLETPENEAWVEPEPLTRTTSKAPQTGTHRSQK
jgi:hypothetical protein